MSQIIRYDSSPIPGSDVEGLLPDSGTSPVLPDGSGYITVAGGLNINTVGTANTLTINLNDSISLTNSDAATTSSTITYQKNRVGGATQNNDFLGATYFAGHDGTGYITGALIEAKVTDIVGTNKIPTTLNFYTHSNTATPAPTKRLAIDENGSVVIDTPDSGNIALTVLGGGITSTGTTTLSSLSLGVMQSSATGVVSSSNGTDGQILIANSDGTTPPTWANITSTGGTVTISDGANSINLETAAAVPIQFDTDGGSAVPALGILTVAGGTNINTEGSGSTVTVNLDDDITLTNESVSSASSTIQFDKSRSGGVITSGDNLGQLKFTGHDGTIQVEGARIEADSTGTIASNQVPGRLIFYTHPESTSSIAQRIILDEEGKFTLNAPDSGTAFTVGGGGASVTGASTITGSLGIIGNNITISDNDNDADGRQLRFSKSRAGGAVQVGDELGVINFGADDTGGGIDFTYSFIECIVDSGTIAADRVPTKLDFYTHPDSAAASPTKNMTLDKDGVLTLHQYSDGAIVSDSSGNLSSTNDTAGLVLTSNGAGSSPTFQAAAAGGISWSVVTGTTQTLAANNGYFANNGTQVDFSLPATAAVGDTFAVAGMNNATGWTITQGAGQTIHFGDTDTTTGAGGSLTSTATYDVVELVCNVANTDYVVTRSIGNITVV